MYRLTEEGKKYLNEGLPELNLVEALGSGITEMEELKNRVENFHIALAWAKKKNWIVIEKGKVILIKKPEKVPEQDALEKIEKGEKVKHEILETLVKRNLVEKVREDLKRKAERFVGQEVSHLTPELIKTGLWKKIRLKGYDVSIPGKVVYPGKKHVITYYIEKIRRIFLELGFKEADGPIIESAFWNFDALFVPQDHPGRDMASTFYMKNPKVIKLPEFFENVKKAHENGLAGSIGWQYNWDIKLGMQAILRTHTTSVSARMLKEIEIPAKVFCIGRVFRNETIDYKHLPEFTQIEGIVVDENVTFRNLLGYLKEFYFRLGFKKIRFRPAYFPYTEMSTEIEVFFEGKNEWLELGGAGIFRPEVTKPLGIDCPVLAWGLSLERPMMIKLGLNDLRNFYYKNDLKFLREVSLWQ